MARRVAAGWELSSRASAFSRNASRLPVSAVAGAGAGAASVRVNVWLTVGGATVALGEEAATSVAFVPLVAPAFRPHVGNNQRSASPIIGYRRVLQ